MKTINRYYTSTPELKDFIISANIKNYKNILLQIFTGICEVEFIQNLVKDIKELIPHIKIIGSTTSGEILDGEVSENKTVLSFSLFDNTTIQTYYTTLQEDSDKTAQNLISQFKSKKKPKVAISFADGLTINGEEFVQAFSKYDKSLILAGGLAGDNAKFINAITFTQDKIIEDGAVIALLYNDDLIVNTKAVFGWENIGKTMTITNSNQNRVYEIDGIKAVDLYAKYLGADLAKRLPEVGIEFPLIVKRGDLSVPRAVLGKHDDGSLTFAGNLNVGDKVTFGYGNIDAILSYIDDTQTLFKKINSESIFIYSCMARKIMMQEAITLELKPLSNFAEVSGFFTYGEFFTYHHISDYELLNKTMTILSLSETKDSIKIDNPKEILIQNKEQDNLTLRALSHLIAQTSLELEEINNSLEDKVKEEIDKNRIKEQQLLQQNRLAQMGEMMGMIAHQWRQPLSAITARVGNLSLQLMLQQNIDKTNLKTELSKINQYAQHLSTTINDFRNFFKENKEKNVTTCNKLLDSTISIVESSIKNKNINLKVELKCNTPIYTYENEIRQVILNLIKNAEDVLLENKVHNPSITVTAYNSHIIIKDNGGGIPKDIIDKIFDPYFSTKNQKDGTGLGLYMSKTIVEDHCNGQLSVSNDKDGAVFTLKFDKNTKEIS